MFTESDVSVKTGTVDDSTSAKRPVVFTIPKPQASLYNIYWLGLTIVLGGQLIYWNLGLKGGFWEFFLTTFLVGTGYISLTLCLAEMTSVLPFAGGSYGYVRCTMGPVAGYLVGCCEAIEYTLYVATALAEFGQLITICTGFPSGFEPLYWVLFYIVALFIHVRGGPRFWTTSDVLAVATLLLILIYIFSAASVASFHDNVYAENSFTEDGFRFFLYFPLASWFFVGVEAMTLTCESVADPTNIVPKAMVACIITLFVTAISILFTSASVESTSGFLYDSLLPLSHGYMRSWGITSRAATILALPGAFSTAFGFMFAYGRQLYAMSRSKLLPAFLSETYGPQTTPVSALLFGSLCGLSVLMVLYYTFPSFSRQLFTVCMLGSCTQYVSIFRAYIICADRYKNLERQYVSPLGIAGAIYGGIVFAFMVLSLAFFQDDGFLSIIAFSIFLLICLLYYYSVVHKREFFSDEEQRDFWKAYLLNASYHRVKGNSDTFLRILPWPAPPPREITGPFPLPSGRLPSKQDPKVNPSSSQNSIASRSVPGDVLSPPDFDLPPSSSSSFSSSSSSSFTGTRFFFGGGRRRLQRSDSNNQLATAGLEPSSSSSLPPPSRTAGIHRFFFPHAEGRSADTFPSSSSSSHPLGHPGNSLQVITTPYADREGSSDLASASNSSRHCGGDYLLASRFDWGDQRIVLSETPTTCLFSSLR